METWKRNLFVCWFGAFATSTGLSQVAPILPVCIEQFGVYSPEEIAHWSGIAFGVTFVLMAVFSPIWGSAADKYGRKPMLLRASLGMAIVLSAMGFSQNVYQLVGFRMLQGTISGFYSASITLVATQTPPQKTGWALGTLSTGALSGSLIGPLIGGYLAEIMGVRYVFLTIGAFVFIAFILSYFFVREEFTAKAQTQTSLREVWRKLPNPSLITSMFITTFVLQMGMTSIQPIMTIYVAKLSGDAAHLVFISGLVFAAPGLASLIAAPILGRQSDKVGPVKVMFAALIIAGLTFIPQAMASSVPELFCYRFLLGLTSAGMLPAINTFLKKTAPQEVLGRIFGYNQAAQFIGSFAGSVLGGEVAAYLGVEYTFLSTGMILFVNAAWVYFKVYRVSVNVKGAA